jgi:preprotein translocase subunit SecG
MFEYILLALLLISAIFIVTAVTIQKTSDEGLSGTIAGGSETYYGKDKAKQSGKLLNKWTLIVAAVFALVVVVVYVMQPDYTTMIAAPGGWKELGGFEFTSVFK